MMFGVVSFTYWPTCPLSQEGHIDDLSATADGLPKLQSLNISPRNRDQFPLDFSFPNDGNRGLGASAALSGALWRTASSGGIRNSLQCTNASDFSGINIDTGFQQVDLREMLWIRCRIWHSSYMFHSFCMLLLVMRWASILSSFQTCSCGGSHTPKAKLCWILSNQRFFACCLCDHARYQNEWCVTDTDCWFWTHPNLLGDSCVTEKYDRIWISISLYNILYGSIW